ncbi:hypothetical protein [Candidatus Thiodiazotropha sp. CDECU1]|uniref:hypothetical protein n=1 Tax=Candidatus Thiodiazotropha sp. CDECU1 TaxID=3065865 RepID=UPI00292D095D|nr:hypothetical protein [Candidatus Thiodiazotropha sp. CDECU1]
MNHTPKKQPFALLIVSLVLLAAVLSSNADETIEDKIYISESESKLNAVIEGANSTSIRLRPKESVLKADSNGHLGAVLTNDRFYVVSTTSGSWKEFRLKPEEAEVATLSLSPYIALLATGDRAIGYNISTNSYFETRLPIREELIAAESGRYVAVVATTGKLFGIRKGSSSFTEIRIGVREIVEDIEVTANKVVVRTSDRLLSFVADDPMWTEHRLN